MKKIVYMIVGMIGLIMGVIGVILPLLPSFPFLLLAAYCFASSSEKLHFWFIQTKLYETNLDSFVKGKGMTKASKIKVMLIITTLLTFGIMMMKAVIVGQIIIIVVWLMHLYIFVCRIKTLNHKEFRFVHYFQIVGIKDYKDELQLEKQLNKDPNMFAKINHSNHQLKVQTKMPLEAKYLQRYVEKVGKQITLNIIFE